MKKWIVGLFMTTIFFTADAQEPALGQVAPDIVLKNAKGDTVKLSSLKGKVVLLDFWASWCLPCRAANKGFVKLYKKYKPQGFEIYSVSVDSDAGKWKKAVKKDGITWLQVNDPGGGEAPTAVKWHITALPTTFLLDKQGKLIAYDLEGKALESKIQELLK